MFLSSWILSSSFPKTWGDEAPKLLPWDAYDNHHYYLNLKCTLVSGPHHDYPWKLILNTMLSLIFAATAFSNVSIFFSLQLFSAASFRSGRTPSFLGLFFSAFPQSPTFTYDQNHHLSSRHNHHGPIIHSRCLGSPQLSNPTITIVPPLLLSTGTSAQRLSSPTQYTPLQREQSQTHSLPRVVFQGSTCKRFLIQRGLLNFWSVGEHCPCFSGACPWYAANVLRCHSRPWGTLRCCPCRHICLQWRNKRGSHPEHHWTCAE